MGKCWLSVGKQRREARSSSDQQGFLGRTNFCRYDLGMDATDDTILLALEIEEAQRNAKETLLHQPVVPTGPGKVLEDVKQLPSLWTKKPLGNVDVALSGFHSFNALNVIKKPGNWRGLGPGESASSFMSSGLRQEVLERPEVQASPRQSQQRHDRYSMYCR